MERLVQETAGFDNHVKKTKDFKNTPMFDAITHLSVEVVV